MILLPGSHGVHDLELSVEPEPFELGEYVECLELLEVENFSVRKPELFDEADVDRDPAVRLLTLPQDRSQLLVVDDDPFVRPSIEKPVVVSFVCSTGPKSNNFLLVHGSNSVR